MKDLICKAFCDTVSVRPVPAGLAVSTNVATVNGDPIGFYIVHLEGGAFRLEDSGLLVPYLHAIGAGVDNQVRRETLDGLLEEYGASLDEDTLEIISAPLPEPQVPSAAVRFVSLLLRVSDLAFMAQEKAASTFKADAARQITELLTGRATVREGEPVSTDLPDWEPDLIIDGPEAEPVAVFLVQSEQRILEAMLLQSDAIRKGAPARVAALLEREASVSQRTRIRAINRLDATAVYDTDQHQAVQHIVAAAVGRRQHAH